MQSEGKESIMWRRVDLGEVLKLMEDLIEYFAQPADDVGKKFAYMNVPKQ